MTDRYFKGRTARGMVSTSTHELVVKFGHRAAFDAFAEAGFEALDYGMFHLPPTGDLFALADEESFAEYFREVKKLADERGLWIYQCHAPFPLKVYDDERDPALLKCAIRSIYASAYMECPHIVIHPAMHPSFIYGRNLEECRRSNFEFYAAMFPALRDTGVTLCIENMFASDPDTHKLVPTTCSSAAQMIDFIDTLNDMCGEKRFAACLDTGHAAISGSGPANMLRELGDRTVTLHVHDNDGLSDRHQIPGIGRLNWAEFCRAMQDVGYSGTFNFEADTFYSQWQSPIYDYGVAKAAAAAMCAVGKSLLNFRNK